MSDKKDYSTYDKYKNRPRYFCSETLYNDAIIARNVDDSIVLGIYTLRKLQAKDLLKELGYNPRDFELLIGKVRPFGMHLLKFGKNPKYNNTTYIDLSNKSNGEAYRCAWR